MQQRKLKVVFGFFPYGGNGASSSEHPDIRNWMIPVLLQAAKDERIEPIYWIPGIDYLDLADTPITMCRNRMVQWAQEVKADVLVMVDSDMSPDVMLGIDGEAKPFFPTSFDFLYKHYEKGPIMIGAPYCGPPTRPDGFGNENVYVFIWRNADSTCVTNGQRLDQYTREEAAGMAGIAPVGALPTGCIMYDMRLFDHIPHPHFSYEYKQDGLPCPTCHQLEPGPQADKASTEDVVATRNMSMILTQKLGYNCCFCNWDAWAGHWKPRCVGKPRLVTADQVGAVFKKALSTNNISTNKTIYVQPGNMPQHPDDVANGGPVRIYSNPEAGSASRDKVPEPAPEPTNYRIEDVMAEAGRPSAFQFSHNTPPEDINALQNIVRNEARLAMLADKTMVIVELGSWIGASAIAMADACELTCDYEIHCVDHWKGGNKIQRAAASEYDAFEEFKKNLGDRFGKTVFPMRGETVQMADVWGIREGETPIIDILFVDADHSYGGCLADIQAWKKYVRPGGIICGHDYSCMFPGVKRAVHESLGWDILIEGTIWAVRTTEGASSGDADKEAVGCCQS